MVISPVKVALLTNIVAPYRFGSYCALHHHAKQAGGGLSVLCTNQAEPQRNWPVRKGPFAQIQIRGLNVYLGENRNLTFPIGVTKALHKLQPDILILVGFGLAQWRAQKWASRSGIPVILQFDGWSGSDALYGNPVRRYMRRQMVDNADGCIAASTHGRDWFSAFGVARENIFISPIPTSFDTGKIPTGVAKRSFSERPFDLMWCGRTTSSKGFDTFIEIAAELVRANTISKIAIIGCTDLAAISDRLERGGLLNITELRGQLPTDQLPAHLSKAKLCLFPSHNDAYGLGVIEAIACGAVALSTDAVGCAPDILDPEEILSPHQPTVWTNACSRLLNNADLWQKTRQRQASCIKHNTAQHHASTLWHAICQTMAKQQSLCQWN